MVVERGARRDRSALAGGDDSAPLYNDALLQRGGDNAGAIAELRAVERLRETSRGGQPPRDRANYNSVDFINDIMQRS